MNQLPEVMPCSAVSVALPCLLFTIPHYDRVEFSQLPYDAARSVHTRLAWMQTIHHARKKQSACKAIASRPGCDLSWHRLRALYYAYAESGDWHVLIDTRKAPKDDGAFGLSARDANTFLEYVKGLRDRNQRKFAPAHVELLTIWRTRHTSLGERVDEIPGYKEWPVAEPETDLPRGWHYSNLHKQIRDKFAEAATRQGRAAAASFRPQVPLTREFLKPGQRVFVDDQWYDVEVNFLGISRRALRPLGLDMLDHCSGCFVAHGFRPRLREESTGIQRSIKVEETGWLLVHYLTNVGYREDTGTLIAHEHGTADFDDDLKALVTRLTHGKVTFDDSGFLGAPAFAGQFEGQSKGNFKFKAPLESAYNLVRNRQAALPGATGKDRQHCPEQLYGLKRYNDRLLLAAEALPPERRKLLQYPLLNWHEFIALALHFYDAIDNRTEHDLQGWHRLGFIAHEYRLNHDPNAWRPMDELAMFRVEQRDAIVALLKSEPHLTQTRNLSPREVWNAHRHELTRLPDSMVATLLGPSEARVASIADDGCFRLEDQELDPEPLAYLLDARMPRGAEYLVFLNPFQPDRLIVHERTRDGKLGGYIGTAKLWGREDVLDTAAIQRRCVEVAKIEAGFLQPIAARGAALTRQKTAMHKHNADVLAGKPVTPEEKSRARILRSIPHTALEELSAPTPPDDWTGDTAETLNPESLL